MWGMCSGRRSFAHGSDAPAEGAVRKMSASSVASPATGATLAMGRITPSDRGTFQDAAVRQCSGVSPETRLTDTRFGFNAAATVAYRGDVSHAHRGNT